MEISTHNEAYTTAIDFMLDDRGMDITSDEDRSVLMSMIFTQGSSEQLEAAQLIAVGLGVVEYMNRRGID